MTTLTNKQAADVLSRLQHCHSFMTTARHEALRMAEAALRAQGELVGYQFQDREGKWHGFMNESHYQNTLEDGTWPIRAIYTHPKGEEHGG